MPRWEVFPARPWPRGFGHRERPPRASVHYDRDQLELDFIPRTIARPPYRSPAAHLRAVLERSRLSQLDFARWVLGCADFTLTRWLRGDRLSQARRAYVERLESVTLHGERILIVVNVGPGVQPIPRWRLAQQRRRAIARSP